MALSDYVYTFGQAMRARYGERVHKLAIDAGFTCPNRDGSKGRGGCTFCNNRSFAPGRSEISIPDQLAAGRAVIRRRTRARRYLAYFQAYTNTYADLATLKQRYDQALVQPGVIGFSIGTRPDCVPAGVLDLLAHYQEQGFEVWLELGLQSSFDSTLAQINRGHDFADYCRALTAARQRGLQVCTHLMLGLPGEEPEHACVTLERVLAWGVDGLKLHPVHVVRGTRLAGDWRSGKYSPWPLEKYVAVVGELVRRTPRNVIYHRLTGTASGDLLLAPAWCEAKWRVLNAIEARLAADGGQGSALNAG